MELSLFLLRAWGLFIVLTCLGFLINKKRFVSQLKKMTDEFVMLSGILSLGIGIVSVVGYENWSISWMGLVTLLGWIAFLKGIFILLIPGYLEKFVTIAIKDNWYTISLSVFLIIGISMLYTSYFVF